MATSIHGEGAHQVQSLSVPDKANVMRAYPVILKPGVGKLGARPKGGDPIGSPAQMDTRQRPHQQYHGRQEQRPLTAALTDRLRLFN
jgi:hypothetical protein